MPTLVSELKKFLRLIDNAWLVPLAPNSKRPVRNFKWTEQRVSYNTAVKLMQCGYNIAYVCKHSINKIAVIDVDSAKYVRLIKPEYRDTLVVKTKRGYHYYYKTDTARNLCLKVIDVRAEDLYVVAPGSCVDNHTYHILNYTKPKRVGNILEYLLSL